MKSCLLLQNSMLRVCLELCLLHNVGMYLAGKKHTLHWEYLSLISRQSTPFGMIIARQGGNNNSKAAMFEAGYKTGFFDGARNAADGTQQPA